MKHGKLALAALAATLLMAIAVNGTASARVFSLTNRNFRVVWRSLELTNPSGFGTVRCPVTLEGSFHSNTISKVEKALIGHVSRASVAGASCTSGPATIKQESLPWHVTYSGFTGILPRIRTIRLLLNGPAFDIREPFGSVCHARTEANHQIRGEVILAREEEAIEVRPDSVTQIPITGCLSAEASFESASGDGKTTLLGNTTIIRIRLI